MNPLLKVPPKRISCIRKQTNIASFKPEFVYSEIDRYIAMCEKDVKSEGTPRKHHRIPEFLLRNFEGEIAGTKKIQAIRYQMDKNGHVSIKPLDDKNANGFSVVEDFYTILELDDKYEASLHFGVNDKYRIEKFLSVIESNASPLIKFRQKESSYKANTFDNPYLYPENIGEEVSRHSSSIMLDTTTGRRVVLAVFFAAQYLRSSLMNNHFNRHKERIKEEEHSFYPPFTGEFFPDWIRHMLPLVAKLFYGRSWRWVYSSYDGFMPEGTHVIPLFLLKSSYAPSTEHSLMMPLGRNSTIYFMELDTFWDDHDGVFRSNSLGASNWAINKLVSFLSMRVVPKRKERIYETIICMHPETTLSHLFKTNQVEDLKLQKELEHLAQSNVNGLNHVYFLGKIGRN